MTNRSGRYPLRAQFSNGSGPVNTLEIRRGGSDQVITAGCLIMPQSGDWTRWDLPSPLHVDLDAEETYFLRISML